MSEHIIKPITLAQAHALRYPIICHTAPSTPPVETLGARQSSPHQRHYGIFHPSDPTLLLGSASVLPTKHDSLDYPGQEEDGAWLGFLAVLPEHQGKGLGKALLELVIREVRAAGSLAISLVAREGCEGFYEKYGFENTGERFERDMVKGGQREWAQAMSLRL